MDGIPSDQIRLKGEFNSIFDSWIAVQSLRTTQYNVQSVIQNYSMEFLDKM